MDYSFGNIRLGEVDDGGDLLESSSREASPLFDQQSDWEKRVNDFVQDHNEFIFPEVEENSDLSYDYTSTETTFRSDAKTGPMQCLLCPEKFPEGELQYHIRLYHPERVESFTIPDSSEVENCEEPTTSIPVKSSIRPRRYPTAEEAIERLGHVPSLNEVKLMARSPLMAERILGQQLMDVSRKKLAVEQGVKYFTMGMTPLQKERAILHVDMKAPLIPKRDKMSPPVRRVTIARTGEGGESTVVIRKKSRSHVVVSLPKGILSIDEKRE